MFLPKRSRHGLRKLRRSPKIFISVPSDRQIVIPFRPLSLLLIIFLFSTTVFFFFRSDVLQVRVLGFKFEGSEEIELSEEALVRQRISEEVFGRGTIFLDSEKVEKKIKGEFLTVKAIEITKRLPDKLLINVSVRAPLAQVRAKGGKLLLVDAEGLLFRESSGGKLPIIDLGGSFEGSLGEMVGGEGVRAYLDTLSITGEMNLAISSIALKPRMIELKLEKRLTILLSVEEPVAEQIELLAQILRRYKIAGRVPKRIDLRFSRPVVML